MRQGLIFGMLCILAMAGCGDDGISVDPTQVQQPTAKKLLEEIAQTGQPIGSGGEELRRQLEEVKKTDAAKGDRLLNDLDQLSGMTNPAQIKAKAKAMSEQL